MCVLTVDRFLHVDSEIDTASATQSPRHNYLSNRTTKPPLTLYRLQWSDATSTFNINFTHLLTILHLLTQIKSHPRRRTLVYFVTWSFHFRPTLVGTTLQWFSLIRSAYLFRPSFSKKSSIKHPSKDRASLTRTISFIVNYWSRKRCRKLHFCAMPYQ